MMKAKKLLMAGVAMLAMALIVFAILGRGSDSPRFLKKYPLLDMSELMADQDSYRSPNWITGRPGGSNIYSFKGDFASVCREARAELEPKGWRIKQGDEFLLLESDAEEIIIRSNRSIVLTAPGTNYKGRYIVPPAYAKKIKLREDVEGWVSIDHMWKLEPGLLDRLSNRTPVAPAKAVTAPGRSVGKPV